MRLIVEGRPFEVWVGEQLRDFTFVDDVVNVLLMAAANGTTNGHIFNLGGDCVINLRVLAELLVEINGSSLTCAFPEDSRRIDIGDYYADDALFHVALGWLPATPLRQDLARYL